METKAQFEQVLRREDESFRCLKFETDRFEHPYHYHPEIELTLILESTGQRMVGDSLKPFKAGDLCLLGANLPHLYHNNAKLDGLARSIVVQFRRDFAGGFIDHTPELRSIAQLLDRAAHGLMFEETTAEHLEPKLEQLLVATGYQRLSQLLEILGDLTGAPCEALASAGFQPTFSERQSARISAACTYIFEYFDQELSQVDVARHIGLSPSAFTRFFQRHTNQSFSQFLSEVRLGRAFALLLDTDATVTEICYEVGFRNLSNFNRRFRARYGASPREIRQQTAKMHSGDSLDRPPGRHRSSNVEHCE